MIHYLFPTLVHDISVDYDQDELSDFCFQELSTHRSVDKSNVHGWQSPDLYADSNNLLNHIITDSLNDYFSKEEIFKPNLTIKLSSLWININPRGASNTMHSHPGCHMSGVFWIKCPDQCGDIMFDNHQGYSDSACITNHSEIIQQRCNLYHTYSIMPEEGKILVFPSSLRHLVQPNASNEDRISASFNLDIIDG